LGVIIIGHDGRFERLVVFTILQVPDDGLGCETVPACDAVLLTALPVECA
jgi:hypothetical protein